MDSNATQTSFGGAWVRVRAAFVNCELANEVLQEVEGWEDYDDLRRLCESISTEALNLLDLCEEIERMNKERFNKMPMR